MQYGQTRPFESGKPIELADKQSLDKADISMPRGSVIAGRIVDEFGDADRRRAVTAMRQTWQNGRAAARALTGPRRRRPTTSVSTASTACRPGDYYVSATLRSGGGSR